MEEPYIFGKKCIEGTECPLHDAVKLNIPDIADKIDWLMREYDLDEASAQACLDWHELVTNQEMK